MSADSAKERSVLCSGSLVWLSLCVLLCNSATPTWSQETSILQEAASAVADSPQDVSGIVHPGEAFVVPLVMLVVATQKTEVLVGLTQVELAQEQLNEQVKQRVFGFIPNFYVSYVPNAAPLTAKQKFRLAWKTTSDPVTFLAVGALAGIDQATDRWGAYGQGAEGYAKRYGATYGNVF